MTRSTRSTCLSWFRPSWLLPPLLLLPLLLGAVLIDVHPAAAQADSARQAEANVMVVHLPAAPIENAARAASALTELGKVLGTGAGIDLRVEIFRRWRDANAYVNANPERVALLLSEASFLRDLPSEAQLQPMYRFVRGGSEEYRRLLVVRTDRQDLGQLSDLDGASVVVVETAGRSLDSFLSEQVFNGRLDPASRFQLVREEDDFSATANVLYQQADAALVADTNPLVEAHLGDDLKALYTSPPLSLPVLSVSQALDEGRRQALAQTLRELPRTAGGALAELGVDGFNALRDPASLWRDRRQAPRALEIALPTTLPDLELPARPSAETLEYGVTVTLPSVPLPEPQLPQSSASDSSTSSPPQRP